MILIDVFVVQIALGKERATLNREREDSYHGPAPPKTSQRRNNEDDEGEDVSVVGVHHVDTVLVVVVVVDGCFSGRSEHH